MFCEEDNTAPGEVADEAPTVDGAPAAASAEDPAEAAAGTAAETPDSAAEPGKEPAAEPGKEPAEEPAAEPDDPALAAAVEDAAKWKDRAARIQADFDNYRKRQAREREETLKQANADLLQELLPVLDQTDTAIAAVSKAATDDTKPFLEGFELVRRTFLNAVAKFGLTPVETETGKPLDPEKAEAISVVKTGAASPGCVAFETRKGYMLGGRLLRAAQVVVESEE